ncbi:MAG TPA: hypothetical protein DGB72_02730 [Gemmatimonadetes bacterium]|nr:hypothetical protein [Gemmatimonadota bacterium]
MAGAYILVLSDPGGLAWVLSEGRMGWARHSASVGKDVVAGDRLFLYASQKALPNLPGAIIGEAVALESLAQLDPPQNAAGRVLTHGFRLKVEALTAPAEAVSLKALVSQIPAFGYERNPRAWPGHLQRGLIDVGVKGEQILRANLKRSPDLGRARDAYVLLARKSS